jgi:hypothetical protein
MSDNNCSFSMHKTKSVAPRVSFMRTINLENKTESKNADNNIASSLEEIINIETVREFPPNVATILKTLSPLKTQRLRTSENNYVLVSIICLYFRIIILIIAITG